MFKRNLTLSGTARHSCFLWGPRQVGKSTLLKQLFPEAKVYDLLLANEYRRLINDPTQMRQELLAMPKSKLPIIIDEVQKCPALLDEVQWLIVNHGFRFILCGSSARKLKITGANLLGGRALRYEMFPLTSSEIPKFDLIRALNHGLVPTHYLEEDAEALMQSYIGTYLKEEIAAEALTRNLPAFARFLESAAFSNGETMVYKNIASDCGVSAPTVKEYFQILEDTLIGRFCPVFQKKPKRRVIESPKFYYFDVGLANYLLKRKQIEYGSESFGDAFEHFIYMELCAYSQYSQKKYPVAYWRTASQIEVDFILGDHEIAIEVKGVSEAKGQHLKGLYAFQEEYKVKKAILVSLDANPRIVDGQLILPWQEFLRRLWAGEII